MRYYLRPPYLNLSQLFVCITCITLGRISPAYSVDKSNMKLIIHFLLKLFSTFTTVSAFGNKALFLHSSRLYLCNYAQKNTWYVYIWSYTQRPSWSKSLFFLGDQYSPRPSSPVRALCPRMFGLTSFKCSYKIIFIDELIHWIWFHFVTIKKYGAKTHSHEAILGLWCVHSTS